MKKAVWDIEKVLQRHGTLMIKLWLQAAKHSGLSREESRRVLLEATRGNYLHLIDTLSRYSCRPEDGRSSAAEDLPPSAVQQVLIDDELIEGEILD